MTHRQMVTATDTVNDTPGLGDAVFDASWKTPGCRKLLGVIHRQVVIAAIAVFDIPGMCGAIS